MNKVKEICHKFLLLKKKLNKSELEMLTSQKSQSLISQLKSINNVHHSSNDVKKSEEKPKIDNIKNNSNKDYLKNLFNLSMKNSSSTKKTKIPQKDINESPEIINEDENGEDNLNKNNTISLKEEDEDTKINNNNKTRSNIFIDYKKKTNKNIFIYIYDKNDKTFNIRDKIIDNLNEYGNLLLKLSKNIPNITAIENFFQENKTKILSNDLNQDNIIYMDYVKSNIHLCFNTLSKIFGFFAKETENICTTYSNNIIEIISLIINLTQIIKKFLKNNADEVDLTFLNDIKSIGKYCKYVLILKSFNYEHMKKIQSTNDDNQKNFFFTTFLGYSKIVGKLKKIFKDNNMFIKHFMMQVNMLKYTDLFEMNRIIINYQLNTNFK